MRAVFSILVAAALGSILLIGGENLAANKVLPQVASPSMLKEVPALPNSRLRKLRGPVFLVSPAVTTTWTVPALCASYNFPTGLTGGGVIGIAEFGGGYTPSDLTLFSNTYMKGTKINIQDVSVNGGVNNFGIDPGADAEVTLDIEIAAAAYYYCTGKAPTIKVFFSPSGFTDDAFVNNITNVVSAASAAGCDVLSISWGTTENAITSTAPALALENAVTAAATKGMITFAASGDGNATNERQGETDGKNHLIIPSSCPHVVAVGGTTKTSTTEVVWNNGFALGTSYPLGTGGGFSTIFPVQSWQVGAPIAASTNNGKGRIVPDVAANADPLTPYQIALDGAIQGAGNGTSAATPLWAGLYAAFGQKLGFISPTLWTVANRKGYTDITSGNNGLFQALVGPDACTGVGVPNGKNLASIFIKPVTVIVPSNVTAQYSAGTLTITGDSGSNSLTVTLQAGVIKVEGANGTKINGSSLYSSVVSGPVNVVAQMNAGDDAIAFVGLNSTVNTIDLGTGNNKAAYLLSTIGTLNVSAVRPGTNALLLTSSKVTTLHSTNVP